jgi:nucleoside-triphosphatase THEP1
MHARIADTTKAQRAHRRSTPEEIRPTLRSMARALILTGGRGAGKTTLCLALAALSHRYRGLLCPRIYTATGNSVGSSARCLATGGEWVLCRSDIELDGPRFGRFSFSSAGIARAVDCLRGILAASPEGGEDDPRPRPDVARPVVIVDEIGPLELELGAGLAPVLPLLAGAGHLLLVARPSLADRVEALLPEHERTLLVVTPENRASLALRVDAWFG